MRRFPLPPAGPFRGVSPMRRPMAAAALWGGLAVFAAGALLFAIGPAWTVTEEGPEFSDPADLLITPGDLDAARQLLDCDGLPITDRFPRRNDPLAFDGPGGAADFRFSFSQGAGLYVRGPWLAIGADGRAQVGFAFGGPWRFAEFQLSDDEQRRVRRLIADSGVFSMADRYYAPGVMDGRQWEVRLHVGGRTKHIWCSNTYPERLGRPARQLRETVIVPHLPELASARPQE